MLLSLAVRNLLRNRRRSFATLVAMAIGCCATLLFGGFKVNIEYMMHTHAVQNGGHLQIQHKDFFLYGNGNPTAYGIADYGQIMQAIRSDPELQAMVLIVSPSMKFGGIAGNYAASVSRTVMGHGYVPKEVNQMREWNQFSLPPLSSRFELEGAKPDAAIVGLGVARVLQLCEPLKVESCPTPEKKQKASGDALPDDIAQLGMPDPSPTSGPSTAAGPPRIELLIGNARGAPNVTSLEVVRAEAQGVKELDEVIVLMQLDRIQQLVYGKSPPKVTSIMVQLKRSDQVPAAKRRLAAILPQFSATQPLTVLDYRQLNPFFVQTVGMFDTIFGFIFMLIGAIVLFTVSNTMSTAVVERTVEIGTLRSMGVRRSGIKALFVTEGGLLGVCGALLGVMLALALAASINNSGFTWWPPGNVKPLPLTMTVWGENKMLASTALGLMAIAVLSAWWPARRAAQLSVVDALRHV